MISRLYKDPLVRRFVSGSAFAAAFVFVAVRYFKVDTDVVWVFLVFSVLFVIGMMAVGFLLSFVIRLFRRPAKGSLLDRLNDLDDLVEEPTEAAPKKPATSSEGG